MKTVKSARSSTLSHTVAYRTKSDAPSRNRTENLLIKSQARLDQTLEGNPLLYSSPTARLMPRRYPETDTRFHAFPHGSVPYSVLIEGERFAWWTLGVLCLGGFVVGALGERGEALC